MRLVRITPVLTELAFLSTFMGDYRADLIQKNNILEENVSFISKPVMPGILLSKIRGVTGNEYGG